MRKAYETQGRLDCQSIEQLSLNLNCRDEIVPILEALKHVFVQKDLRDRLCQLVADDVNKVTRDDTGREGLGYWQILVLAIVRLGCNLNYDKLQDLCENHRALRCLLGEGEWDESPRFRGRRIRDTLTLLEPETIATMNELIVAHGQDVHGDARRSVRADSFVVETNIHHPTESSLIWDGIRKIIPVCVTLATLISSTGWRQAKHLKKQIKRQVREIARISASKSPQVTATLPTAYGTLLTRVAEVLDRAELLQIQAQSHLSDPQTAGLSLGLDHWLTLTKQVCDTAYRRTVLKDTVANSDKLFSLFEPHTQLYRRGKAGQPNQFGRQVLVYEDAAGFISHYHLMDRAASDAAVVVKQTRIAQGRHRGEIEDASFDRGFFSEDNRAGLEQIVAHPCLPPRHRNQYSKFMNTATLRLKQSRQRHSGIESAIGALQSGNGLERCRDRTETGFDRYLGLAILGRNMHVLGKLLIARSSSKSVAGKSERAAA
ncbi:MAG: ISNCY family transposase [Fuerstiella sp.]